MRYSEIALKILFLIGSIYFIVTKDIASPLFNIFLIECILLGLVLVINKKDPSYRYPHTTATYVMRGIEAAILIIFANVTAYMGL